MNRPLRSLAWLACSGAFGVAAANAQPVLRGERLSEWLLRQGQDADTFPIALSWRSAAELSAQTRAKHDLAMSLRTVAPQLAATIEAMPATGRVRVKKADARWLQIHPEEDPVLQDGDTVILPRRTEWVAVMPASGELCLVRHEPDVALAHYLRACSQLESRSRAWLIQPDGAVFDYGLRRWNREAQLPPAPGAWIWAPGADNGIDAQLSERLARFLATQGPASDAGPLAVLERKEMATHGRADELRDSVVTTNDWGVIGLWQTPTARLGRTGSAAITFSHALPYNTLSVNLQPFDWLAGAFRYTDIRTLPYVIDRSIGGDQSYKDKSIDMKIRLRKETEWLPEVALGWRDLMGTGMFSGEYVVANKRADDLDFSLGLGFGYLGTRGNVSNPLGYVATGFKTRPVAGATGGGGFSPKAYFRGPAALFGGVQYHTPISGLIVKAEIEGNDYQHEGYGKRLKTRSPLNVGVVWRYASWLDVSLALERGHTAMLALSTNTQLDGLHTDKILDPKPVPVLAARPHIAGSPRRTAIDVEQQTDIRVGSIEAQGSTWTAVARDPFLGYAGVNVDKAMAVLHRDAPADIDRLAVRFEQRGATLMQVAIDRDDWAKSKTQLLPPSKQPPPLRAQTVEPAPVDANSPHTLFDANPGALSYGVGLNYRQNLGGPDAFILYQLAADARAEFRFRDDTWIAGSYRVALLDNYDRYSYTAPSRLPRVRTLVREYSVASRTTIPNLQLTHLAQAGQDHFFLAYGGLLETMYAGVGAEYMYRPVNSNLAWGLDLNAVRQREFQQKFGLRAYRVNTGHATAYWDTGFSDILAKVSVGQYLAGDRGATIDLSRAFDNGVSIGVYATKTNVSAAQFGEGSFDKGLYVHIPFDAILPRSGPSSALITYNPLIRDGGAKLGRRYTLYDLTHLRDARAMTAGAPW